VEPTHSLEVEEVILAKATTRELEAELERLWDLQEQDEWPQAKAIQIRKDIDRVEKELRFRRSR
jgi:hypothetical protein